MIKYDNVCRLSSALSRNQKKILKAFNMNNGSILMDAQYIAETLKKAALRTTQEVLSVIYTGN